MKKRKQINLRDGFFSVLFKNLSDDVRQMISFKSHIYGNQGDEMASLIFKQLYLNNTQK